MPKVSIIVPCYNHARYLEQRLASVYGQDYRDCEVILLDDGSTDDSRELLESYPKTLPTRCVFNEKNSGSPFPQWLKGIGLAEGELIWIAESDDDGSMSLVGRLVRELEAHPEAGLAFCQSRVIDRDGLVLGLYTERAKRLYRERYRADFAVKGADECARVLLLENSVPNASGVLFRKRLVAGVEAELPTMRYNGDWLLWAHILSASDLRFVAEPLNAFRLHAESQTRSSGALRSSFWERLRILEWIARRVPLSARDYAAPVDDLLAHGFYVYRTDTELRKPLFAWLRLMRRTGGVPWRVLLPGVARFVWRRTLARLGLVPLPDVA